MRKALIPLLPVEFVGVAADCAESSFSAPAVQRSSPNPNLHNDWYRNLMLVKAPDGLAVGLTSEQCPLFRFKLTPATPQFMLSKTPYLCR